MTRLRRLALKISSVVVCRVPEESKEWAQAMAQEIEFIPGDWAALRWALGSTRMLLQRCETRVRTMADVPNAARRFAREIRRRTRIGLLACAYPVIVVCAMVHTVHNPTKRIGTYLLAAGMIYIAIQLIARRGTLSTSTRLSASPEAYRLELARQRDFHRGGWLWSRLFMMVPGFLLFCIGQVMAHPNLEVRVAAGATAYLTLLALSVPANLKAASKYQRRINDLDAAEKNEV